MSIHRARERALIGRLIIDLLKTIYGARRHLGDQTKPYLGGDVEYILLSYAVLIGVVSGRPKNATELGRFVDIPRASAQRKLDELEKNGVISRKSSRYQMGSRAQITGASAEVDDYIDRCLLLIKRAAKSL